MSVPISPMRIKGTKFGCDLPKVNSEEKELGKELEVYKLLVYMTHPCVNAIAELSKPPITAHQVQILIMGGWGQTLILNPR